MKYRYFILNPDSDQVFGTNDRAEAVEASEETLVIDAQEGLCLNGEFEPDVVEAFEPPEEDEPEDEDD